MKAAYEPEVRTASDNGTRDRWKGPSLSIRGTDCADQARESIQVPWILMGVAPLAALLSALLTTKRCHARCVLSWDDLAQSVCVVRD
jgi:hypothetical protein